LNLKTPSTLEVEALARLKVKRVPKSYFNAEPARIDLGKAVEEAAEKNVVTG
jgi:hypothetical protein